MVLLTLAGGAAVALLPRLALALFAFPSADDCGPDVSGLHVTVLGLAASARVRGRPPVHR